MSKQTECTVCQGLGSIETTGNRCLTCGGSGWVKVTERRMFVLDGVVHVSGECCRQGSPCQKCKAPMHMTGGYMGPLYACENCDSDWTTAPESVRPGVEE